MIIAHNVTPAQKRKQRVRGKLYGTAQRPRLTIFRSNKSLYLQVIDDEAGKTLASENSLTLKKAHKGKKVGTKGEQAQKLAQKLAEKLKKQKITKLCFDRGSYAYHGRLKTVAEVLREAGVNV